jgi:aspartokinase
MNVEKEIIKSPILAMKFGGTSVGSVDAIQQSCEIVSSTLKDWPRTVVVLSALSGVTNQLLEGAARATEGNVDGAIELSEQLRSKHHTTAEGLLEDMSDLAEFKQHCDMLIDEFSNLCGACRVVRGAVEYSSVQTCAERTRRAGTGHRVNSSHTYGQQLPVGSS